MSGVLTPERVCTVEGCGKKRSNLGARLGLCLVHFRESVRNESRLGLAVREIVDQAPALTESRRIKLRAILAGGGPGA
jgi:hypothetical protein